MSLIGKIKGLLSSLSVNSDGHLTAVDLMTDTMTTIEYEHCKIHRGDSYMFEEGIQLNDATKGYLLETPDYPIHFTLEVTGSQDTHIAFYELSSGLGTTGTQVFSRNRNRNSGKISDVVLSYDYGGTGSFRQLISALWGIPAAAGGRGGGGGEFAGRHEWILKPNWQYLVHVNAWSANPNNITVSLNWYEQK